MRNQPTLIDVYSGVGGLSLGAARAGFDVIGAIDKDPPAVKVHEQNFPSSTHLSDDVVHLSGRELLKRCGLRAGELDGLIGGPPCQGFSDIGRHQTSDKRNKLVIEFMRLVAETRPKFFLMENVPGIISDPHVRLLERAANLVPDSYDWLPPLCMTASEFGAPTARTRYFFLAYDPRRMTAPRLADLVQPADSKVTVRNALRGLPKQPVTPEADDLLTWTRVEALGETEYARHMQAEPPRRVGDADAVKRFFEKQEVCGCIATAHTKEVTRRFADLQFGERDQISKAIRLHPWGHCPTLRAGTGSDRGSYQAVRPVHPTEPRVITPREAARLQGFPDWFRLHPTKWHSFRQIGNSVSPIIAEHLLRAIQKKLV